MHITSEKELGGHLAFQGYTSQFRFGVTRDLKGRMKLTVYLADANIYVDISPAEATELAFMLSSAVETELQEAA